MLYLNDSRGRARVKDLLGQANHLIITALVGLDAIERGLVKSVPDELNMPWSPSSPTASARRSRRLILDMTLIRAVDAIDIYVSASRRTPRLTQAPELRNAIDNAKLSVMGKFNAIEQFHRRRLDPRLGALVAVMIAWRNRSVHADADDLPDERWTEIIAENGEWYAEHFSGLSAEKLIADFNKGQPPVFKEIGAFIRGTHKFILNLEEAQFNALNGNEYVKDLVKYSSVGGAATSEARLQYRMRIIQSVWGRDISDRPKAVYRFLKNAGLSETKRTEYAVDLTLVYDEIATKTTKQIMSWLDDEGL